MGKLATLSVMDVCRSNESSECVRLLIVEKQETNQLDENGILCIECIDTNCLKGYDIPTVEYGEIIDIQSLDLPLLRWDGKNFVAPGNQWNVHSMYFDTQTSQSKIFADRFQNLYNEQYDLYE